MTTHTAPRKRLTLVDPQLELSGKFPRGFERTVKLAQVGDARHRGLLFCALTIARRSVAECLPPSSAGRCFEAWRVADDWARGLADLRAVRQARAESFTQLPELRDHTLDVVRRWLSAPSDAFTVHRNAVIERYVALSVHHATGALLECFDGVTDPTRLLEVPKQAAAALAYRNVALGPARNEQLLGAALENAAWQADFLASPAHDAAALAVQLFHEYLGVHWKNHVDAQRLYLEQFLAWAVPDDVPSAAPSQG